MVAAQKPKRGRPRKTLDAVGTASIAAKLDKARLDIVEDGLLDMTRAADLLGLSTRTLYEMLEARKLPFVKVNGRRKVPRKALINYMAVNLHIAAEG